MQALLVSSLFALGFAQNLPIVNGPPQLPMGSHPLEAGINGQFQGQVVAPPQVRPMGPGLTVQGQGQLLGPAQMAQPSQPMGTPLSVQGQGQLGTTQTNQPTGPQIVAVQPTESPLVVTGQLGVQPVPLNSSPSGPMMGAAAGVQAAFPTLRQNDNQRLSRPVEIIQTAPVRPGPTPTTTTTSMPFRPQVSPTAPSNVRQNPLSCGFSCSRQATLLMNLDNQFSSAACSDRNADPIHRCANCCGAIALANGIQKSWSSGFVSTNGKDCICCINRQNC